MTPQTPSESLTDSLKNRESMHDVLGFAAQQANEDQQRLMNSPKTPEEKLYWWIKEYDEWKVLKQEELPFFLDRLLKEATRRGRAEGLKEAMEITVELDEKCLDFKIFTIPDDNLSGSSMCGLIQDRLKDLLDKNKV